MGENVVFTGMAKAPEKRGLVAWGKEKLKKTFTPAGVEDEWRKMHAKEIQELTTINASLSDEDRVKAMEKLEKDIKRAVVVKVAGNYGAAALVTGTFVYGGFLVGNENVRKWTATNVPLVGKGLEKFGQGGADFLTKIGERMRNLSKKTSIEASKSEAERFWKPDINKTIWNAKKDTVRGLIERLDKLNMPYNLRKILPNGLNFSLGSDELNNMQAEAIAEAVIQKALKENGQWQPLFMQFYKDGSVGWIDQDVALKPGWWDEAIKVFIDKDMVNLADLGKGMRAFEITEKFAQFVKRIAAARG